MLVKKIIGILSTQVTKFCRMNKLEISEAAVVNLLNLAQVPKVAEPAKNSIAEKKVPDHLSNIR